MAVIERGPMNMKLRRAGFLVASVLVLGGCATTERSSAMPSVQADTTQAKPYVEPSNGSLKLSALRTSEADYEIIYSPEALAEKKQIVAAGVVDGWQQGPILNSFPGGPLDYRVLMRVRITHPLKGVKGTPSLRGNIAFIEFDQGAVIRDDSVPVEQWKIERSPADFEKSIPTGTRVLLFGSERPPYEQSVYDPGDPLTDGAKIMAVGPQGLVLEDPGLVQLRAERTLVGGREPLKGGRRAAWLEPKTMDQMIDRLKKHGFSE
ncbi:hypothetical protein IMZ11_25450 [Microtetraspora sp. AC03309]|uniref:hypothetical protein n=1 Tax=Microtetraspora sp. AC03309 TaxID=2779376 RepID=UPI001E2A3B3C|nr:hypothetical protein [Microtetraspora sp. AC03309]MCC5578977.1 hypothetical protein [Microtetraspora sp. AC03309]